jgi:hypothetical protein
MRVTVLSKDLEPEEVDFIKANYLQISIKEMAEIINTTFSKVRNCMKQHNLDVDAKTIQDFRIKSMQKNGVETKIDFWNHNLNPITMYRINH